MTEMPHTHPTAPATGRLRLVALLRVSTNGQVDAYGFDAQTKDVKRYAKNAGHRIVKTVRDEGITGKADEDDRQGLAEALAMIANGEADGLLSPNLDRLARQLTQQEAILSVVWAHGGRMFTADHGEHLPDDDDDPMRTFVRQVMGAAAQLERGLITKRLRNGRKAKAEQGGYAYGAPRYGTQANTRGELEENPEEAGRLEQMRTWQADGMSVRAIAAKANELGWTSKRGGAWHPTTVARALSDTAREKANEKAAHARKAAKERATQQRAEKVIGRVL
jgi:DNA invertase Pin-like site-specific DNA recombinase